MINDTPEYPVPTPADTVKPTMMDHGKKAATMAERTATAADNASNAISAIKWTAIAIVALTFAGLSYGVYKLIAAPAKAAANAAGAVSDGVKAGAGKIADGAGAIKDGGAGVINRLDIPVTNQTDFNALSEQAFTALNTMAQIDPDGVRDRIFRAKNFGGNDGRICTFTIDPGTGPLPVTMAADNEAHATAKALGSLDDRLMRFILVAGDEYIAMKITWDNDASDWVLGWKSTTIKKPIGAAIAAARAADVLAGAARECK